MTRISVPAAGVEVEARPGETVLAALVRAGYGHRVGCRRGGCGVCKVDVVAGSVRYPTVVADTVLTQDERAAGRCLTCRAVPSSDVELRMLDDDRLRCVAPLLAMLAKVRVRTR
jgi:ferredoxin